jgi:branched-chain amino acid transport system substrate-binding protein
METSMSYSSKWLSAMLGKIALCALGMMALNLHAQGTKPPLRVGLVLSLSGPAAAFGIPERDAIQAVTADVNANGGVDGRPIELVIFDDKTNPTEATRGVTQMATNEKVIAVIGPGTGGGILAAGPIAERLKMPLLAPAGTVAITDKKNSFYPWIFRTIPNDFTSIRVLLSAAVKNGAKRVAIIYQEDPFGKLGMEYAQKLAGELNFEVTEAVSAPQTATDLSAQALRIRNSRPDAVFVQLSIPPLGAAFVKSMRQLQMNVPTYVGLGLSQKAFFDAVGAEGEGLHVASIGSLAHAPSATEQKLVALLAKNGKEPKGWAELAGTSGLMAIISAARKVQGEITPEKMRTALETTCGFPAFVDAKPCYTPDNHDAWGEDSVRITVLRGGKLTSR